MKNFNVLVVTPTPTHPTTRGNRKRIFQVTKTLQNQGGNIYFAYFPREWLNKIDPNSYRELRDEWEFLSIIHPSKPVVSSTDQDAYGLDDWWDDEIGQNVNWLGWGVFFDIVIVNYVFFSRAFEWVHPRALKVLDTHDRLGGRKKILQKNNLPADFFYTTEADEARGLARSDVILAIKSEEAEYFRTVTDRPVVTLGHFESLRLPPPPVRQGPIVFGYVGSENPINCENLRRFMEAAAPLLDEFAGRVEVWIGGLISTFAQTLPDARMPQVRILGRVASLDDFYASCDYIISPYDFGTGLKIKTVEAVCYGKAVIGTAHAFEGITSTEPSHQIERIADLIPICRQAITEPEALRAHLEEVSQRITRSLRDDFEGKLGMLVEVARQRRCAFVPVAEFWKEDSAPRRRAAFMIRRLSELFHVHIVYPHASDLETRDALQEWQWKNMIHANVDDASGFIATRLAAIRPVLAILQAPPDDHWAVDAGSTVVADVSAETLERWKTWFGEDEGGGSVQSGMSCIFSTGLSVYADLAQALPRRVQNFLVPMIDTAFSRSDEGNILVLCDDLERHIDAILRLYAFFSREHRRSVTIDVHSCAPVSETLATRLAGFERLRLVQADACDFSVSHGYRACVHLGVELPAAVEIKSHLVNRGVCLLRLDPNPSVTGRAVDHEERFSAFGPLVASLFSILFVKGEYEARSARFLRWAEERHSVQQFDRVIKSFAVQYGQREASLLKLLSKAGATQ
ncbi:glycosyltransferase [Azospirillum argentinense]